MVFPTLPTCRGGIFHHTSKLFTHRGLTGWIETHVELNGTLPGTEPFEHFPPQPSLLLVLSLDGKAEEVAPEELLTDTEAEEFWHAYVPVFWYGGPQTAVDEYLDLICERHLQRCAREGAGVQ